MRFGLLATAGWLVAAVLTVVVSWNAVDVVRQAVSPAPAVAQDLPVPSETAATSSPPATTTRPTTPSRRGTPHPAGTATPTRWLFATSQTLSKD